MKIINYLKKDMVLTIATILALLSCFIIHPNEQYLNYIDFRTLALLFCLMCVMAGFQEEGLFLKIGEQLLAKVTTKRGLIGVLVMLCFFSSMLITNDVALITFVPFAILVLNLAQSDQDICLSVVLMTIAANLGSMFTPIGNPQNLYLYSLSKHTLFSFVSLLFSYVFFAFLLLSIMIFLFYKDEKIVIKSSESKNLSKKDLWFYSFIFMICLLSVAKILDYKILFLLVLIMIGTFKRKVLFKVDYNLLLTFVAFFIFIGNMGKIEAFQNFVTKLIAQDVFFSSVLISQIVSNVPAALLLSKFTNDLDLLILGTNIGGLGTLIASMASLISYKQIALNYSGLKNKYILTFTLFNVIFLIFYMIIYCLF